MRKRTKAREYVLQMLYQVDITRGNWQDALNSFWESSEQENISAELKGFSAELLEGVILHMQEIDKKISKYAANWQLERMAFVDRNIMRLGCLAMINVTNGSYIDMGFIPFVGLFCHNLSGSVLRYS